MKEVYIFDVDGTLTPAREPMQDEMIPVFEKFCNQHVVFLASGSDYAKIKEQIPMKLIYDCMGVFCCMGNELRVNSEIIYSKKIRIPSEVTIWLYDQLSSSKYPRHKTGTKHFEYRAGMLNFSTVGRDVDQQIRSDYYQWDLVQEERLSICSQFNKLFKQYNLEACVGGKISIDIQGKGLDKGQIYDYLSMYDIKIFFGDKCEPSGNDFSLYQKCEKKFPVNNWQETAKILSTLNSKQN